MATPKAEMTKLRDGLRNPPATLKNGGALEGLLQLDSTKRRFSDVLGDKAAGFMSSVLSACNTNPALAECNPATVLSSAMVAATLDLPINSSLGFAAIVPYNGLAQFQIMKKGLVQLALRSGQYATLHATRVYEGQLKSYNPFTGEIVFNEDPGEQVSDRVIGYVAYERLLNGFEKYVYMSKENAEKHGKKFSKSYAKGKGVWADDFDAMGEKTVLKALLSNWGLLSIEMRKAIEMDQAAVVDEKTVWPDNDGVADAEVVDGEKQTSGLAGETGPNEEK